MILTYCDFAKMLDHTHNREEKKNKIQNTIKKSTKWDMLLIKQTNQRKAKK